MRTGVEMFGSRGESGDGDERRGDEESGEEMAGV